MDAIKGVNQIIGQLDSLPGGKGVQGDSSKALKAAVEKADMLQKEADKVIQEFSLGKTSLHETMIAIEKADISFQLMLQVRNKIVTAYEDVMRMQV